MRPNLPEDAALLDDILRWRDTPAAADLRGLPKVSVPAIAGLREQLPADAARRVLGVAYAAARRIAGLDELIASAPADSLAALRERPLVEADAQAQRVANRAGWVAGGAGAALGLGGIAGLAADAPVLLIVAMRGLMRMAACYGETPSPALVASLLALGTADTPAEKTTAWNRLLALPAADAADAGEELEDALRDGLERAVERELTKQALNTSAQRLVTVMATRFGARRLAGALPVLGAVVGGAVNIRFMYRLAESARMALGARRLRDAGVPLARLRLCDALEPAGAKLAATERVRPARRKPASKAPGKAPSKRTRTRRVQG